MKFKKSFFMLCVIIIMVSINIYPAKIDAKTTIESKTTVYLVSEDDWLNDEEDTNRKSYDVSFEINKKMILAVPIKVKIDGICTKGGFRIKLIDNNGNILQNDYEGLKDYDDGETYDGHFYSDGFFVNPGKYTYRIINTSDASLKVSFSIDGFSEVASKAKLSKDVKVKSGNWKKIGCITNKSQYPYIKNIKTSKKGMIDGWRMEYNGNIYIHAKNPGSGKVTVQLKNGKKYKTKLTITKPDPDFYAALIDYNTRDNYFTVKFKNLGIGTLKIYSSGAYSMDVDYKSYDRKLTLSGGKVISIKSGKSKKVRFKVIGKNTWYNYSDHTIRYYFSYYGKKYLGSTWDEDSVYKNGKHWYATYWNQEKYNIWLYY